jgi:hypothetical protein
VDHRRVLILDLAARAPAKSFYARVMNPNFASLMPQAVAAWCEELGHDVSYVCYTGFEDLDALLAHDTDVVFIQSFTRSALTAYAIANLYRRRGIVTVLGGPHARCYPEDALKYFDYVLGFTGKDTVDEVLRELSPRPKFGRWISAARQPSSLPGVAARWRFITSTNAKEPFLKIVPMIGSTGCPYTCSFCIDASVEYQPLPYDQLREDLRFLLTKRRRPIVGWHDPNFGVRFDDYMEAIEDAVRPGRIRFGAESSLSLLSEERLKRLKANGFIGMLPGIESWFEHGAKSKTGRADGMDKVRQISEHVNMVLRYIPYVQTNFVVGLDGDRGEESFELTKRFVDLTPGAFPAFNLFTAYGRAAALNLELQQTDRVLPFPFFFLDNNHAMNVRPLNHDWQDLYRLTADLQRYTFSGQRMWRRFVANRGGMIARVNLIRGRAAYKRGNFHSHIHRLLDGDVQMQPFFEGRSNKLPKFYVHYMREKMGRLWEALPPGAITHDHNAFRKDPDAYRVAGQRPRAPTPRALVA